jgi:hypothetical protein
MPEPKRIRLKVASPCEVSWDSMTGDEAVRFCRQCKKNVYDLSLLTSDQIEALLASKEAICGRFFQRADGTVMTSDCSVGGKRRRRKKLYVSAGAGFLSAIGVAFAGAGAGSGARATAPLKLDVPDQGRTGAVAPSEPPALPTPEVHELRGEVQVVPEAVQVVPEPVQVIQGGVGRAEEEPLQDDLVLVE